MNRKTYLRTITPLTAAGVLFSGYLSGVRMFSNSCAFEEPCPMFLGYPACYFGFAMFLSMFALSTVAVLRGTEKPWPARACLMISTLGTLFAGSFAVAEIRAVGLQSYGFGLSTCVYGALFFTAILVVSLIGVRGRTDRSMKQSKMPNAPEGSYGAQSVQRT